MQTKRNKLDYGMMLLPSLEEFVPKSHYLRRLDRVLDLSFVHKAVADKYCQDNGRPSVDPEAILRLFLLQAIEGIPSIRKLMQRAHVDLAYRWFLGYKVDEKLPDHSTLSRALDRFGDKVFNELFELSVSQCQSSGLIDGKVLHVDATTIRADLDATRVNKPDSPDKDARFGRFPDGTKQPGYKQQTVVDDASRVILEVSVKPANANEGSDLSSVVKKAASRLDSPPVTVCADSAYASGQNAADCYAEGVRLVSPPRVARNHHSHEQFTIDQFEYNDEQDIFICPAGKVLKKAGRMSGKRDRFKYRASAKDCRCCQLKSQCTRTSARCLNVTSHHGALVRLRADSKTDSFKKLYRSRAPVIEGIFAEAKQWHGLRRAWRRGLSKMLVQCLLVSAVLNFKRLIAISGSLLVIFSILSNLLRAIWSLIAPNLRTYREIEGR